jgi:hypothetical protein
MLFHTGLKSNNLNDNLVFFLFVCFFVPRNFLLLLSKPVERYCYLILLANAWKTHIVLVIWSCGQSLVVVEEASVFLNVEKAKPITVVVVSDQIKCETVTLHTNSKMQFPQKKDT